jgi:HSP20 family protein
MGKRRDLIDEIDELFADLWQVSRFSGLRGSFRPELDCFRTEDPPTFTVLVDIAGIDPEQVHVTASDGTLVVAGEREREPCEPVGRVYQQMEIEYGPFERAVRLPEDADISQAHARYDRGLLTIVVPIATRVTEPQDVPIEIRRSSS